MTLTIRTIPDAIHTAFNPVVYEVSTNRTTTVTKTIASIAAYGGKLKITTTTAHTLTSGDVVSITGITGLASGTRSLVTLVDTTNFVCDSITWSSSFVNTGGQVVKDNRNVVVRAQVYYGGSLIATHYTRSETSNGSYLVYRFDLSGVLSDYLDNNAGLGVDLADSPGFALSAYSVNPSRASTTYYVTFAEFYDDPDGLLVMGGTLTAADRRAVNMVLQPDQDIDDYICTASSVGHLLTPLSTFFLRDSDKVTLQCLTTESSVGVKLTSYATSGTSSTTYGTKVTVYNNRIQTTVDLGGLGETQTKWEVAFYVGTSTVISDTVTFYRVKKSVRLAGKVQWRNLLGGVDTLHVLDYSNDSDNDSEALVTTSGGIVVWAVKNDRSITMTVTGTPSQLAGYEQLLTSRFIWFNGSRCNLVNRSQTTQSREYITWQLKFKVASLKLN